MFVIKRQMPDISFEKQHGLVACFVLCGSDRTAQRRDLGLVAEKVSAALSLQESLGEFLKHRGVHDFSEQFFSSLRKAFCLDRILLAAPVPRESGVAPVREDILRSISFLQVCQRIFLGLFNEGLPMVGAVGAGEFCWETTLSLFTGEALVEAQERAMAQDWIGCTMSEGAEKFLRERVLNQPHCLAPFVNVFLEEYETPLKNSEKKAGLALDWAFPKGNVELSMKGNVRENLLHAVTAHGPELAPGTFDQINRTEVFLNLCKRRADFVCGVTLDDALPAWQFQARGGGEPPSEGQDDSTHTVSLAG